MESDSDFTYCNISLIIKLNINEVLLLHALRSLFLVHESETFNPMQSFEQLEFLMRDRRLVL